MHGHPNELANAAQRFGVAFKEGKYLLALMSKIPPNCAC